MRSWVIAVALTLAACASGGSQIAAPACSVSAEDREWIDGALNAWRFSEREITGVGMIRPFEAVFFDDDCTLTSRNAFTAENVADVIWRATPHTGEVALPDGQSMPAGVASFASADGPLAYFVMSTPSVWRAAGVTNEGIGLEAMMTGVLLHEGSHVAQSTTYGARISAIASANNLSDDFDDDSIQRRFGDNAEFDASVERETELFFQAAAAPDQASAYRLAREAREMMRAPQARWYTGADAYLAEVEDIWLTFEGSGQWLAYQWLVHPSGGGLETADVLTHFARRGRWWSQKEGVALALVVGRLSDEDWKREAFGGGSRTLASMLDTALAN